MVAVAVCAAILFGWCLCKRFGTGSSLAARFEQEPHTLPLAEVFELPVPDGWTEIDVLVTVAEIESL